MQNLRWLFAACLLLLSPAIASAASISIGGQNLVYDAIFDGPVSDFMQIELFNATPLDPTLLASWNLSLVVAPIGGATGTLEFASPGLPSSDYILAGNSGGLILNLWTPTSLAAGDDDPSAPFGVSVPSSGKYLFQTAFSTPDNARGTFGVYALPIGGGGFTSWGDSVGTLLEFTNLPLASVNPVLMGTVTVIPEPASVVLLGLGSVLGVIAVRRLRRG